jgi:hypothetical protein
LSAVLVHSEKFKKYFLGWLNILSLHQNKKLMEIKRSNAGRKTVDDKKIPVQVYVRQSHVEKIGGIFVARDVALSAILAKRSTRK